MSSTIIIEEEEGTETLYSYSQKIKTEKVKMNELILNVNNKQEELQTRINQEKIDLATIRKKYLIKERNTKLVQANNFIRLCELT